MKKSKLPISLVATFVAAMGMSSCSGIKSSKTDILTFKGYDGVTYSIITDDMYAEYQTTENITKFYNPILEVMVRNEFKKEDSVIAKATKSYATIEALAKQDVADQKVKAEESSESYSTAWEAILESFGVENEKELLQHFIYEREKEEAENWYYDTYKEYLTKEYIGITNTGAEYALDEDSPYPYQGGTFNSKLPYHIRHILVSTSGKGSEYGVDTISETEAKNLGDVVDELLDGTKTFGQIAITKSGDSGSKEKYGDAGIMTNKADANGSLTMVQEFQLGIYAYDVILGTKKANATAAVKKGLGISATVEANIKNELALQDSTSVNDGIKGLTRVPASVFEDIKKYASSEWERGVDGYPLAGGKDEIYPRNILFNKYLNHHNPFIITNNERVETGTYESQGTDLVPAWGNEDYNKNIKTGEVAVTPVTNKCGYRSAKALGLVAENANDFGVLCDEQGNVIIGVRTNYGIHFMIVQKSILDFDNNDVSLEEYYTTYVPSDVDYPKNEDGSAKSTYVNYITTGNDSDYKTRADEIKSAIKGYDSTYEYRLFEKLYEMNKSNFNLDETGEKLIDNIFNYIKVQRESKAYEQENGISLAWEKYFEMIEVQNQTRQNNKRVIPEGCIVGFKKGLTNLSDAEKAEYEEGGVCYYGK